MKKSTVGKIRHGSIVTAFLFLIAFWSTYAQDHLVTLPDGRRIIVNNNEPLSYFYTTENGKLTSLQREDPKEVVKVIVTLTDPPLALYRGKTALKKASLASIQLSLQALHSSVKSKISAVARQLSAGTNFQYQYSIKREYYTAINGMAIECNRGMLEFIRGLPEVKNVQPDKQVKADLTQSVRQIRADFVQDSLGYKGDSVLVGVVDSGIDYNNPALGGGFGPGFRVTGGYDFANNNNDPMDDFGHGTRVAGIIGANGGDSLRGVAPHVKFLAVKVIDNGGIGTESDDIAGIDYCMDPDGNPLTDDGVDIINMSLSGHPGPDSPRDNAIDNATRAGILSVVAAGNSGSDSIAGSPYKTISSPGTAMTALTVGACDSTDQMADFSSKGPDPVHYAMKPEVVAPGVGILSTTLNNGTASGSGTSFATPHVTGVAALLKQQHRDWSPEQLKAAIINSAISIGDAVTPYVQGNGRIDALNAARLCLTVQPGVLSFGEADLSLDVWRDTLEFTVMNHRITAQNIHLELQDNLPAEVGVAFSRSSFSLASHQEASVTVIVSVPQSVPVINTDPFAYTGKIICSSDSDRIPIPFGFIKSNSLVVECDIQPTQLLLLKQGTSSSQSIATIPGVFKYTAPMSGGTFDLLAILSTTEHIGTAPIRKYYCIIRKNINTSELHYIAINHDEAVFPAFQNLDRLRDSHNNPIAGLDNAMNNIGITIERRDSITQSSKSYSFSFGETVKSALIYLGPMDSTVAIKQTLLSMEGEEVFSFQKSVVGITSQKDLEFPSGPENLNDIYIKYFYGIPSLALRMSLFVGERTFTYRKELEDYDLAEQGWFEESRMSAPLNSHLTFTRDTGKFDPMNYTSLVTGINVYYGSTKKYRVVTSDFRMNESGGFDFFWRTPFRPDTSEIVSVRTTASGDTLNVDVDRTTDIAFPMFEVRYEDLPQNKAYLRVAKARADKFYDEGIITPDGVEKDILSDQISSPFPQFQSQMFIDNHLQPCLHEPLFTDEYFYDYNAGKNSRCRLLTDAMPYTLLGQSGQAVIDHEFTVIEAPHMYSSIGNCFLPSLDVFQVWGNGRLAQWLQPEQDGTIRLVLFDPKSDVDRVGIYLLENDGTEISLPATHPSAKEYFASLPKNIPVGFMDVVARVHNTEGNTFDLTVSPAFYYGAMLDTLHYDSRLRMCTYSLNNSVGFVAGDTLKYTLSYINYGNTTARNISVHFPRTDYLEPMGNTTLSIDSLQAGDTCRIPLALLFLGKKEPGDVQTYYTPSISWNSGGKPYLRNHTVLVTFRTNVTDIEERDSAIPGEYSLYNNYPNPFNPSTTLRYSLPENAKVRLEIFNILGQKVATLADEIKPAGSYTLTWNAEHQSSGVYFCRLKAEGKKIFEKIRKLVLVK